MILALLVASCAGTPSADVYRHRIDCRGAMNELLRGELEERFPERVHVERSRRPLD